MFREHEESFGVVDHSERSGGREREVDEQVRGVCATVEEGSVVQDKE